MGVKPGSGKKRRKGKEEGRIQVWGDPNWLEKVVVESTTA